MATVTAHLVEANGTRHTVQARAGKSLMRAATDAGIDAIAADCGGCLTCATCHVIVAPEWLARLPPVSDDEAARRRHPKPLQRRDLTQRR